MRALVFILGILISASVEAAVRGEVFEYPHGEAILEGYLAYDDASSAKRPGILVVHEWKGLNDYAKRRAEQLAGLGYIAFAVDMYGKGVRPKDHEEAAAISGIYRKDRQRMRERILAALEVLKKHPLVDSTRLGAIGYCFGGTAVLELARSGADVDGVVSFHGALATPMHAQPDVVKARLLVCHGAGDPHVPPEDVKAFEDEMRQAGVYYHLVTYEGAVHGFTVPEAGDDPSRGVAYNAQADRQSWEEMKQFFSELFAG